jgi:hypothetical protein
MSSAPEPGRRQACREPLLQANTPKAAARGVAEALEKDMEAVLTTKADLRVLEEKLDSLNVVAYSVFAVISKLL